MAGDTAPQSDTWESALPCFSTVEKHGRITVPISQPPKTLRFFAGLAFMLWMLLAVGAAFWLHGLSHDADGSAIWLGMAVILGLCVPILLSSIVADGARGTFGQRSTANWVAVAPALAGLAIGLLGAALWFRDFSGGVIALLSMACTAAAAIAAVYAWKGIRYTRSRQDWLAALRQTGVRSPGVLRNVKFLKRWTADDPQFTVTVEFKGPAGRRVVTANMVAHHSRVPLAGSAVVVFSAPHDTGTDVLIELDPANPPKFDRDPGNHYRKPSGN